MAQMTTYWENSPLGLICWYWSNTGMFRKISPELKERNNSNTYLAEGIPALKLMVGLSGFVSILYPKH